MIISVLIIVRPMRKTTPPPVWKVVVKWCQKIYVKKISAQKQGQHLASGLTKIKKSPDIKKLMLYIIYISDQMWNGDINVDWYFIIFGKAICERLFFVNVIKVLSNDLILFSCFFVHAVIDYFFRTHLQITNKCESLIYLYKTY